MIYFNDSNPEFQPLRAARCSGAWQTVIAFKRPMVEYPPS